MAAARAGAAELEGGSSHVRPRPSATWNGISGSQQAQGGDGKTRGKGPGAKAVTPFQAMLWKYTARCALPKGQELEAPDVETGKRLKFPGFFGIAPEWRDGACDSTCQEKVSACLIALTNRTGMHVLVSILSGDPSLSKSFLPDDNELDFPHQEGAFFGNVFSNEAYACQGHDVQKAPQVKRFCALEPTTCSGLTAFVDAGRCQDACQMSCSNLSDGSQRCVAKSCKAPGGKVWSHPVTIYLRNKIEAVNADDLAGVRVKGDQLESLDDGDAVRYRMVDFGDGENPLDTFAMDLVSPRSRGHIDIWLDDHQRIGVLTVKTNKDPNKEQTTSLGSKTISGHHEVTLKIVGGAEFGHFSTFELRRRP